MIAFALFAAASLLGRWDLTLQSPQGETGGWLELTPTALRVVARVGGARPIKNFEVREGRLIFSTSEWFGRYEKVSYDLHLERGELTGTAVRESGESARVTGARAPALDRKVKAWAKPVQLFDGKGLAGWKVLSPTKPGNWSAVDGALVNARSGPNLRTEAEFQDFRLHAEFNCPAGSNSGIFLRGRYEIQIEEGGRETAGVSRTGAVYQFLAPQPQLPDRPGEWRTLDITLVGRTITVVLDGTTIIDAQEIPGPTSGGFNSRESEPGPIILQGDHGAVSYRNLVLTPAAIQ
jgi:hypothetical protein